MMAWRDSKIFSSVRTYIAHVEGWRMIDHRRYSENVQPLISIMTWYTFVMFSYN